MLPTEFPQMPTLAPQQTTAPFTSKPKYPLHSQNFPHEIYNSGQQQECIKF